MKHTSIQNAWKTVFCTVMWFMATVMMAQTQITVETAGTLASVLPNTEKNIKVVGPLNGTDIKYLREMVTKYSLSAIDLSEARIVSGGEPYFEERVTSDDVMGESMFASCSKLTTMVLPAGLNAIGANAFARSGLRKVDIPNEVTSVGRDAFAYCSSLNNVVVGKRVSRLDQGAFYSSPISQAYIKPLVPPSISAYLFSSNPTIHVYSEVLNVYKSSSWKDYGTIVGDLEKTYPYEKDPIEEATDKFTTYFDDAMCTRLQAAYAALSDEELTAKMTEDKIPEALINAALKIKNDKWAAYEKDFRIHAYKPYSDATYWNDKMKSTGGSYMGNPTGIYTKGSDYLFVFVDDDIPSGTTLYLAGCVENDLIKSATTGTKLHKGANVIEGVENALYYVVYTADTKTKKKTLAEWPQMNIHIEGGVVNGYYELSRHSDADYKAILAAAKLNRFTVKGDESVFHFKTTSFRKIWPNSIDRSICWFDSITVWEKELMGYCQQVMEGKRDFYPHNVSGGEAIFPLYYNNPNFAIEGEEKDAGWANSTPYRTSYNSEACIKSAFDMTHPENVDDWCSAHECGHNNQGTINLEGCTETSNNLFSYIVRFQAGLTTSSGASPTATMDGYTEHIPYYLRPLGSRMRMYYQLYLYFHQARKNTAFYPTLHQELRKSPLSLYSTNNYNGGLKFVRMVCKVAQQDLTEFFRAWGFFEPGVFTIEDYGTHTVNVRQTDIDKTLKEIAAYPVKNREILFIEDRVDYLPTCGFAPEYGVHRRESELVGQCGKVGQFTDFMKSPVEPAEYSYLQADSLYSMIGTGGVGFMVRDAADNLLYGSNDLTFCVPSCVGKDYTIYAVDADGTLHPVEKGGEGKQYITLKSAGTLPDSLSENTISVCITGPINGTDVKCLRTLNEQNNLIAIDLSEANVRTGGVAYYQNLRTAYNVFGEEFFHRCKRLQIIKLPNSVTRIGKQALARSGIKSVEIPKLVTTIDGDAFAYCDNLTEVIVGEKVRTIAQGAFYSSPIKDIYVKPNTPPSVSSYLLSSNPTIHVHKAALAKYQASAWNDYGNIVGDLDDWETAIEQTITEKAQPVGIIQKEGEMQVQGLKGASEVTVHTLDGKELAKAHAANGCATLQFPTLAGQIVVVSAGGRSFKLMLK